MNNYYIPCSQILDLYLRTVTNSIINGLKPYELSLWLKSQTNNKFIVIERRFIIEVLEYIELNRYSDEFLGHDFKTRWYLKMIKELI